MSRNDGPLQFGGHSFSASDLGSIVDGVADGITVQDATGKLIYANPAAAHVIGFSSAEAMIAAAPADILGAYHLFDEFGEALPLDQLPGRRALAGGQEEERLIRFRVVATGEDRWSVVKSKPAFDENGAIRFAVNIWHDVTDRILRQEALEQNSQQLEEMAAELEATVSELEAQTEEAEAARARAEYTAERQRFLAESGRLLAASLDPEATLSLITHLAVPRMADWCTISLVNDYGEPKQIEVAHADPAKLRFALDLQKRYPPDPAQAKRIIKSGESELYTEITDDLLAQGARDAEHLQILRELQLKSAMVVPMKIRGRVLGIITFIGAESGRRYDNDDLEFAESLAARSALALTNARLFAQAQEANQAKADFLAVMSHELRTPLTAIFGYTELLATGISGAINEQQETQLGRIKASASHLLGIIEDILSYARAEAGTEHVHTDTVTAGDMVREAMAIVQPVGEKKHLTLTAEVRRDCVMKTDRGKIRQILVNLVGNAVKFTEEGSVTLLADCEGDDVVFTVTDTGVGIAEMDLDRIFEPFRQLQPATTRTTGGTGLGLAVSRRFAELLGGTIKVKSQTGAGSVFTVRVPARPPVTAENTTT